MSAKQEKESLGLNEASDEVKLAVDLIYLLETHEIAPQTALAALELVVKDVKRKLANS